MVRYGDGSVQAIELPSVPDAGAFARAEAELAETLTTDDAVTLANVSRALRPSRVTKAAVVTPFASAHASGRQTATTFSQETLAP